MSGGSGIPASADSSANLRMTEDKGTAIAGQIRFSFPQNEEGILQSADSCALASVYIASVVVPNANHGAGPPVWASLRDPCAGQPAVHATHHPPKRELSKHVEFLAIWLPWMWGDRNRYIHTLCDVGRLRGSFFQAPPPLNFTFEHLMCIFVSQFSRSLLACPTDGLSGTV